MPGTPSTRRCSRRRAVGTEPARSLHPWNGPGDGGCPRVQSASEEEMSRSRVPLACPAVDWLDPESVSQFESYAAQAFARLGGGVRFWATLNEPKTVANLGYGVGQHAPGLVSATAPLMVAVASSRRRRADVPRAVPRQITRGARDERRGQRRIGPCSRAACRRHARGQLRDARGRIALIDEGSTKRLAKNERCDGVRDYARVGRGETRCSCASRWRAFTESEKRSRSSTEFGNDTNHYASWWATSNAQFSSSATCAPRTRPRTGRRQ